MFLHKRYLILPVFVALSSLALGQAARTPFSTFGIGEPYGYSLIQNQGMGGVGVSQPQYWGINNQNPALLVYNYHYSSFQAGALLESRTLSSDSTSQKGTNGNLNYLVTSFPLKRGKWTTSVGIMPFTTVNYKLMYDEYIYDDSDPGGAPVDTASVIEQGDGGLTQVFWAHGVRINRYFAAGIRASYLFGSVNTDYANTLIGSSQTVPFIVGIKEKTYVKDFMFGLGLSFSKDSLFNDDYRFSVGVTYNFASDLNADKTTLVERRLVTGNPITSDTLINNRGSISIPSALTIGISFSKSYRWSVGTEFSMQDWSKFESINEEDEGLKRSWKIAAGGEFTPDPLATSNYFKRVTYRAGFSYEKNPFAVNNNQVKDLGINFGFSLPAGRSSLDWAFRIGKRGDKTENTLEESYYKIYFGITFNDQWFIRRRFD